MANPNLVRKVSDSPTGSAGEVSYPSIFTAMNKNQNLVVNGNFDFWQRSTSFTYANQYTADRWRLNGNTTAVGTISQQSGGPNTNSAFFLRSSVSTADTTVSAGKNELLTHFMEGYLFRNIYGKTFTVSFWVRCSIAGIMPVCLQNGSVNRCYVTSVAITQANTWEYKTITLTHDTTGTWDLTSGRGIALTINLIPGSTYTTGTVDAWQSGEFYQPAGTTNFLGQVGLTLDLAQVQINEGSNAAAFSPFGKTWLEELEACQRYYEKSYALDVAPGSAQTIGGISSSSFNNKGTVAENNWGAAPTFTVRKRAIPTVTIYNPQTGVVNQAIRTSDLLQSFSVAVSLIGYHSFYVSAGGQTIANGNTYGVCWVADAEL